MGPDKKKRKTLFIADQEKIIERINAGEAKETIIKETGIIKPQIFRTNAGFISGFHCTPIRLLLFLLLLLRCSSIVVGLFLYLSYSLPGSLFSEKVFNLLNSALALLFHGCHLVISPFENCCSLYFIQPASQVPLGSQRPPRAGKHKSTQKMKTKTLKKYLINKLDAFKKLNKQSMYVSPLAVSFYQ